MTSRLCAIAASWACLIVPVTKIRMGEKIILGRHTRHMDDIRDIFTPFNRREQGDSSPRRLVMIARDAYNTHVRCRRIILDCVHIQSLLFPRDGVLGLTSQRRGDSTPADVAKVRNHALLERGPDALAFNSISLGRSRGQHARGRCGRTRDELDEQPAVLQDRARQSGQRATRQQTGLTLKRTISSSLHPRFCREDFVVVAWWQSKTKCTGFDRNWQRHDGAGASLGYAFRRNLHSFRQCGVPCPWYIVERRCVVYSVQGRAQNNKLKE